jgi:hypothetical protein
MAGSLSIRDRQGNHATCPNDADQRFVTLANFMVSGVIGFGQPLDVTPANQFLGHSPSPRRRNGFAAPIPSSEHEAGLSDAMLKRGT